VAAERISSDIRGDNPQSGVPEQRRRVRLAQGVEACPGLLERLPSPGGLSSVNGAAMPMLSLLSPVRDCGRPT
jgi:hypothetical protein